MQTALLVQLHQSCCCLHTTFDLCCSGFSLCHACKSAPEINYESYAVQERQSAERSCPLMTLS